MAIPSGPIEVLNIRLKAKGKVSGFPVLGLLMPYFWVREIREGGREGGRGERVR